MGSPQQHPGNGMLPWMRQLGADPPSLHLPLLLHLARMLLWLPPLQQAQSQLKKKEKFGGPNPGDGGEGGCERARSNREGRETMEEKEEQRERQEQEDRRVREARDTEERRHREAVEREEMREREARERDERYLALLELIAKK